MSGRRGDPHRDWLELVDADGPFLSIPALRKVWPTGMPQPRPNELAALRDAKPVWEKAWDRWDTDRDDLDALADYRDQRDAWADVVLRDVLGWKDRYRVPVPAGTPADALVRSPDHTITVRPTGALVHRDTVGALVLVTDPVEDLRDPLGDGWAFSPIDRMTELLRVARVPIGVVTDGRWWAIVSVPLVGGGPHDIMPASGVFDAQTWIEAPAPRDAFIELLRLIRLVGGSPKTGSPSCSTTPSPPPRRSPRRWAPRCGAPSNCSSRHCPRRRSPPPGGESRTRSPPTATTSTARPSRS